MFKVLKNRGGISTFTINLYNCLVQLLTGCFAFFYPVDYKKDITVSEHIEVWEVVPGCAPHTPEDYLTGEKSSYLLARQYIRQKII